MAWLKGKLSFALALGVLGWASGAHAVDRVVVLTATDVAPLRSAGATPAGAESGFFNALSIQLVGAAEVETRALPEAPSLGERVRRARELAEREQALLVVWAEPPLDLPDGSKESVLYAIGQREGRALLEVVRIPGGQGPDMDRTLALKVRDMVDELQRLRERVSDAAMVAPAAEAEAAAEARDREQVRLALGLGAVARPQPGTALGRWGGDLALGPSFGSGALRLEGLALLRVLPPVTIERADGKVRLQELAPWLRMHGQLRVGSLWIGVLSGFGLGFVHADGRTAAGSSGTPSSSTVFSWQLGVDAEVPLGDQLAFALGLELQTNFRRQRYAINGREVLDLERFVPLATLGLRLRI